MKLELTKKEIQESIKLGGKVSLLLDDGFDFYTTNVEEIVESINLKGICKAEVSINGNVVIEYNEDFVVDVMVEYSSLIVSIVGLVKPIINVISNFSSNIVSIVEKYTTYDEK